MRIRINAFRITLIADNGIYGATASFDSGLNIIRAENTSGKSALMNGMLYALGLEILVGKRGKAATKPVLWNKGDYENQKFNVLESFVEMEIANALGKLITIRRYIAGDRDDRLIEVTHVPILTEKQEKPHIWDSFFVGIEGSAQRERGFHHFLAEFLNFELPYVKRFKGDDVPLYIECIAPLMFIEQNRGWTGIQATMPQNFGIRNAAKLAVEYILGLDVIENEKKRIQISEEANSIREDWRIMREMMLQIAHQVGGKLLNVPANPINVLPDEPQIIVSLNGSDTITLDDLLISKRSLFIKYSNEDIATTIGNEQLESKLNEQENRLFVAQAELSQLRSDIHAEIDELQKLHKRLNFIKEDIQRNKDIKRLRDFGGETGLSLVLNKCPTCNQAIKDSLVPTESAVMGIEENISFLKTEAEAIELLISSEEERIPSLRRMEAVKSQIAANLRGSIRDLRSDLLKTQSVSVSEIREQVKIQEEIERLERLRDEFDELLNKSDEIIERWNKNRSMYLEIPKEYFSDEDKCKLDSLKNCFIKNARLFGYRSTDPEKLRISEDNYRPISDDFEVAYGASGSDNIRLIWAYTLALLQVSLSHGGKHWGILLFDEPEQQNMKKLSSDALYKEISKMHSEDFQVIIATSASVDVTNIRVRDLHHKLLEFGDRVIRPINDNEHENA